MNFRNIGVGAILLLLLSYTKSISSNNECLDIIPLEIIVLK